MEKQLSYVSKLSLQEIALRRVAVVLWNDCDILASIGQFRYHRENYQKEWRETVESKVADKLHKIQLPKSLTKQMIHVLKPIGLQILRWKLFHEAYVSNSSENYDVPILANICWTAAGAVDYRKTAEKLVRSDMMGIVKRYLFSCLYCLDDCILEFWKELPETDKSYFYSENSSPRGEPLLEFCWPYVLEGKESELDGMPGRREGLTRFHQYAFEFSAIKGNKTAAEYFFQKLTHEEREDTLIRTAQAVIASRGIELCFNYYDFPKEKVSDVFCYLLSLMTREERIRIFQEQPCKVLKCFLDWPWQDFFLDFSDFIWTVLAERDYDTLLLNMSRSIVNLGYYSPNLFQNFFLRSPANFRKLFVDRECYFDSFFSKFFNIQDAETIKVIFRNVDAADRMRLVSSEHAFKHFYNSILRGRWHMVEVCLLEASLSIEYKERLKEDFMKFLKDIDQGHMKWRKRKWRRFFEFLDGKDPRAHSKRKSENQTLTETKKLFCKGLGSCDK